ncbi:hypothetical protein CEXT_537931 [Caerostris extrusa]|uniref:Uncharacterized protein n=1 Tax=Caerostris extrusa TaxID=172846 RepID=A0AAV4XN18_CAEEX|nr:hypothetical protein CEXT_537931 [Caerostris extrusa]
MGDQWSVRTLNESWCSITTTVSTVKLSSSLSGSERRHWSPCDYGAVGEEKTPLSLSPTPTFSSLVNPKSATIILVCGKSLALNTWGALQKVSSHKPVVDGFLVSVREIKLRKFEIGTFERERALSASVAMFAAIKGKGRDLLLRLGKEKNSSDFYLSGGYQSSRGDYHGV